MALTTLIIKLIALITLTALTSLNARMTLFLGTYSSILIVQLLNDQLNQRAVLVSNEIYNIVIIMRERKKEEREGREKGQRREGGEEERGGRRGGGERFIQS